MLGKEPSSPRFCCCIVTVIDRLEFVLAPPSTVVANESSNIVLNCAAHGKKIFFGKDRAKHFLKITPFFQMGHCF